jgi:predicted DNA-binding transcriptional regulator YafY
MWKLGGALDAPAPAGAVAALPGSEHLADVFEAVTERRPLTFGYRGGSRTVDPWRIAFRNGHWYVNGFDHERREERSFRLDRFDGPPAAGDPGSYERAEGRGGPRPPWEMGDDEELAAELLVDAPQAGQVVAELGPHVVVEQRDDGSVVVALRVTNREAFRTMVLGLLDHAEVLGPPALRDDIVTWLDALASSSGAGTSAP